MNILRRNGGGCILINICPVCNGLITLEALCPNCREIVQESTQNKEAELDPYAPYEEGKSETKKGKCMHQIVCPNCDSAWHITLNKINC